MPTPSHSLSLLLPRHTRLTPRVLRTPKNQLSIGLIRIPAAMPVTRRGQQSASFSQMALLFPKISRHIIFAFQFPQRRFLLRFGVNEPFLHYSRNQRCVINTKTRPVDVMAAARQYYEKRFIVSGVEGPSEQKGHVMLHQPLSWCLKYFYVIYQKPNLLSCYLRFSSS